MNSVDYWFFVRDVNQYKWAIIRAPELPLEEAKKFINELVGTPVLNIGYGSEVPQGFRLLPEYPIELKNC